MRKWQAASSPARQGKSERKPRALLDPIHDERIARGSAGASGKAPPLITPSTSHGTTSSLPARALLVVEGSTKLTELLACAARSGVGKTVITLCIGRQSWRIYAGLQTQEEECQQGNGRELLRQGVLAFGDGGGLVSGEVNFGSLGGIQTRIRRLRVLILFAATTSSAQSRTPDRQ